MTQEKLEQRAQVIVHRFLRDFVSVLVLGFMVMAIVQDATGMQHPYSGRTVVIVMLVCPAMIAMFRIVL